MELRQKIEEATSKRIVELLDKLGASVPPSLDAVLLGGRGSEKPLNKRQEEVVKEAQRKRVAQGGSVEDDMVIDLAKSALRHTFCVDGVPCIVTNSAPWRSREQRFLTALELMRLQGT